MLYIPSGHNSSLPQKTPTSDGVYLGFLNPYPKTRVNPGFLTQVLHHSYNWCIHGVRISDLEYFYTNFTLIYTILTIGVFIG